MTDDLAPPPRRPVLAWLAAAALAIVAVAVIGWMVRQGQAPPRSVRPVIWDQQTCEHCKMAISEPAFAAQLQTEDGRVFDFDDPGCLFRYQGRQRPEVHALYFHAMEGDAWLSRDEVAFATGVHSPMGHGLGAVRRGTPGALSYEEAVARVVPAPERRQEGP